MYTPTFSIHPHLYGTIAMRDETGYLLTRLVNGGQSELLGIQALPAGTQVVAYVTLTSSSGLVIFNGEATSILAKDGQVSLQATDDVYELVYSIYVSNPLTDVALTPGLGYLLTRATGRHLVDWALRGAIGRIGLALLENNSHNFIGQWSHRELEASFVLLQFAHYQMIEQAKGLPPRKVYDLLIQQTREADRLTAGLSHCY
ncbi:MAG: hypothetical protein EOO39_32015 [Cytophagaceae bacterium]|nr:MAG: hypothetical protein EOO39_32015 [Cytophagaceae bacterium]